MKRKQLPDVQVSITVEIANVKMGVGEILSFRPEQIVHFDTENNTDVTMKINNAPYALGEIVVVDDKFGIKITKFLTTDKQKKIAK